MIKYIMLLVGFLLLIKGADYFVEGSSSVAKILKVPSVVIGLTVVAFGTSTPELAVSMAASFMGNNDIAVGNVIGSNIFNLLMVLGVCSIIAPMSMEKEILNGDFLISIAVSAILLMMSMFDLKIGRFDGIVLLAIFVAFMYKTVKNAMKNRDCQTEEVVQTLSPLRSGVYIIGGLIAIVCGGNIVVDSASEIAKAFGLSDALIGLTVVAFGTSLPELVTSVVASGKGENGLALGNVIGSNLFNILMVLASSATICPLNIKQISVYDLCFLIVASILVWITARTRYEVSRKEGAVYVLLYAAYMVYIVIR